MAEHRPPTVGKWTDNPWAVIAKAQPPDETARKLTLVWQLNATLAGLLAGFSFTVLVPKQTFVGQPNVSAEAITLVYIISVGLAFVFSMMSACLCILFIGFVASVGGNEEKHHSTNNADGDFDKRRVHLLRQFLVSYSVFWNFPIYINIFAVVCILISSCASIAGNYPITAFWIVVICGLVALLLTVAMLVALSRHVDGRIWGELRTMAGGRGEP